MKYLGQLKQVQLKNKTCLLRIDLNIEIRKKEAFRIQAILPTIKFLVKNGARVVILSHRGRPNKFKNTKFLPAQAGKIKNFFLRPFAEIISQSLKKPVHFLGLKLFSSDIAKIKKSLPGTIFLLENLRFLSEEEKNDRQFAKFLASLGDIYINDAFAVSHRANASVAAITKFLPSYVGLVLEKEIQNLNWLMKHSRKPLVIILGGAKVSDKIGLINNFLAKADYFLIAGAMANTFFAKQGLPVGDSLYEEKVKLENLMSRLDKQIILPKDVVIYQRKILDIGPETIKYFQKIIQGARTIIWNGPLGWIEKERFTCGTKIVGQAILKNKQAKIVIGGGETIASLPFKPKNQNPKPGVFLSTGGGAMMEYLAGKKLPGIKALKDANMRM